VGKHHFGDFFGSGSVGTTIIYEISARWRVAREPSVELHFFPDVGPFQRMHVVDCCRNESRHKKSQHFYFNMIYGRRTSRTVAIRNLLYFPTAANPAGLAEFMPGSNQWKIEKIKENMATRIVEDSRI